MAAGHSCRLEACTTSLWSVVVQASCLPLKCRNSRLWPQAIAEGEKYFLPLAKRIRGRPRGGPCSLRPPAAKSARSFLKASIPLVRGTNVETQGAPGRCPGPGALAAPRECARSKLPAIRAEQAVALQTGVKYDNVFMNQTTESIPLKLPVQRAF